MKTVGTWLGDLAQQRIEQITIDEPLKVMLDVQNEHDPEAVAVRTENDKVLIGYFPRYLAGDVKRLLESCPAEFLRLSVHHVNLNAPLQNRVLCRLIACWPESFDPCSGDDFVPIPAIIDADCIR